MMVRGRVARLATRVLEGNLAGAGVCAPRCLSAQAADLATLEEERTRVLEVWAWGRGDAGQLGLGDEESQQSPRFVTALPVRVASRLAPMQGVLLQSGSGEEEKARHSDAVAGIACGLFHSGYWAGGQLWMWGRGDGGRLGLGSEVSLYKPTLNPHLDGVKSLALGGLHSVALLKDGSIYTWGFGGFGALGHGVYTKEVLPREVKQEWAEKPVQVAAGGSHTAAITQAGELYTWGRDEGEGRLGLGFDLIDGCAATPMRVESLPVPVHAVACGGFFTMALTGDGQVWSWGGNSNYELGTGDRRSHWRPRPVAHLDNVEIRQVACGGYHTAALTADGRVFTWGHGGHGQLGHGSLDVGKVPTVIQALTDKRVVHLACGGQWTVAVTESGEIFSWGKNRDWQVGVPGLPDVQAEPVGCSLQNSRQGSEGHHHSAIAVAAGASHGVCLGLGPIFEHASE